MKIRTVVVGAAGRVGRTLVQALHDHPAFQMVAGVVRPGSDTDLRSLGPVSGDNTLWTEHLLDVPADSFDSVIDFSTPDAVSQNAPLIKKQGKPWLIGVTGLTEPEFAALRHTAETTAVLYAPNTSPAAAVMMALAEHAMACLGEGYDVEIRDIHRRDKRDAPSGTALALGEAVTRGCAVKTLPSALTYLSSRGGDTLGAHDVSFYGRGETLVLSHAVHDRALYAEGALRAALWLMSQTQPGLYSLQDVYGLTQGLLTKVPAA